MTSVTGGVCPAAGVWDMRGKQFHRGVEIHCWALAVFAQYRLCPEDKLQSVSLSLVSFPLYLPVFPPSPLSPVFQISLFLSYLYHIHTVCFSSVSFFIRLFFTDISYSNSVGLAAMPVSSCAILFIAVYFCCSLENRSFPVFHCYATHNL